jgi:hypothetical protein
MPNVMDAKAASDGMQAPIDLMSNSAAHHHSMQMTGPRRVKDASMRVPLYEKVSPSFLAVFQARFVLHLL